MKKDLIVEIGLVPASFSIAFQFDALAGASEAAEAGQNSTERASDGSGKRGEKPCHHGAQERNRADDGGQRGQESGQAAHDVLYGVGDLAGGQAVQRAERGGGDSVQDASQGRDRAGQPGDQISEKGGDRRQQAGHETNDTLHNTYGERDGWVEVLDTADYVL